MAKPQKAKIERPCADCNHLHEGKCTEDGCFCEVSRVAEVSTMGDAPTSTMVEAENPVLANDKQVEEVSILEPGTVVPVTPINALPLQERIANLLEDYAIENRIPVGCDLVIAGQCFSWNGEKMTEAEETVPEPPIELSDADKTKLREFVAEQAKAEELPDGSVMLPLRIDVDQIEVLRAWAE